MGRQINKYIELSAWKHCFLKGKVHSKKGNIPLAQTYVVPLKLGRAGGGGEVEGGKTSKTFKIFCHLSTKAVK